MKLEETIDSSKESESDGFGMDSECEAEDGNPIPDTCVKCEWPLGVANANAPLVLYGCMVSLQHT